MQYPQQSQQYPYQPDMAYGQQSQQQPYGQQYPQQGYLQADIPVGQPVTQYPNQGYQQYPQQSQYQPYGMQQSNIVNVQQHKLQSANGCPFPVQIHCPYCKNQVGTIVETRVGDHTLIASCIVLILCWPLFWIPCVMDDCKDRVHLCPNCRHEVGTKKYEMC